MHPGPMNRGVEIDGEIADDLRHSVIQEQVEMGVAVRMAAMDILMRNRRKNTKETFWLNKKKVKKSIRKSIS